MEFTESSSGERATVQPPFIASHEGMGVWRVRRLPAMQDHCTLHAGSVDAKLVWHDAAPWVLFHTADAVIVFCLTGRDGDGAARGPGHPDGVIREARHLRIDKACFLDGPNIAVFFRHGMGMRCWSLHQRHQPVLSTSGMVRCTADGTHSAVLLGNKSLVVFDGQLRVVDKWRVPDGAIVDNFMFLESPRHYSGRYGIVAWQSEISMQIFVVDDRQGFVKVAADDAIFAIHDVVVDAPEDDICVFTDRTGSFTLFNLLTRTLVCKVAVDIEAIKRTASATIVFREVLAGQSASHFDAGYGDLLGAGTLVKSASAEADIVLEVRKSRHPPFLAIKSSQYPSLLFIYSVQRLAWHSVLFMVQPVASFSWHPTAPLVFCSTASSSHIYSWQPEGARCVPHPHGLPVDSVEWSKDEWCLVRSRKCYSIAVPV